jgi:hypothetical protein
MEPYRQLGYARPRYVDPGSGDLGNGDFVPYCPVLRAPIMELDVDARRRRNHDRTPTPS